MNKSIFGEQAPKFVYNLGSLNQTEVLLDYWLPLRDEPEEREIVNESSLESVRTIIDRGDFWTYEGRINLFKYESITAIRSKFEEIYQFNKKAVTLWKHRDGQPFKDKNGNNVLFYMKVIPKNLQTLDYKDILMVSFRSLKGIYFSNGTPIVPQLSEIIMSDN